jgi:hypothetical protein
MKDGTAKTLAQCATWGLGAVASAPSALSSLAKAGLAGTGCAAGIASDRDPSKTDNSSCAIWGIAAGVSGVITHNAPSRVAGKAIVGCVAGALSNDEDAHWTKE